MHLWIPATVQCDDKQRNSKAEHPLFALSFFGEWLKEVAEESCETNIFVALRIRSDGPRPTDRCLFVTVQLEEDLSQIKCDSASPVNLIVSSTFIHHYRINLKEQHELKVIQPTVLDKIVLGAKTREVYMWLNEKNWMTEFLVKVCQQKVLSRRGDVFLAPLPFTKHLNLNQMINHVFDILTLDCHPVAQGIISVKTEIIVNDLSIDKVSDNISELKHTFNNTETLHSFENYLSLLQYMYSSTFLRHVPRKRLYNSMISVYIASASKLMLPPIMNRFRIRILTKSPFLNCRNAKIDCIDPFNVVFISEWVSKRLQLQDKCWVKLALHPNCNSLDTVSKTRLAQVCILNFENLRKLDHHLFHNLDDTVYLSPHIMFNMVSKPSSIDYHDAKISIEKVKFSCQNRCCRKKEKKCLSFARETHLSLVCSPGNETSDSYTNLLNKYFDTPRYLQTGDVICISTSDDEDFTSEESLKPQQEIIFFQTISVESICKENKFGSLVQKGESTLFLNEDCQSYIPVSIDIFLGLKDLHPIWCSPAPLGMTNYIKRLESLIVPYMNFKNIRKCLGSSILITGPSGCGKSTVIQAACRRLNMHFLETDCHDIVGDKSQTTITRITQVIKKACRCVPCTLVFKNVHLLCRHRDGSDEDPRVASAFKEIICENLKSQSEYPLTIIGTTNEKTNVTDDFHEIFLHQITIKPPDEAERKDILFGLLSTINCASDVSIQYWAQQTAGFLLGDFAALIKNASHRAYNKRLTSHPLISFYDAEDLYLSGVFIENEDLKDVLNEMQAAHSDVIGAPKVPDTNWQDIGGLEDVKEAILETIQLPLQHPELFSSEIRRSGVLLFGPPGTGKTLLAKAVATECNLHFLSVKGPELLNMYVGQSEQNVRTVFLRARSASPCVIFFDELDSLAPNRGRSGDSGGVMDRVVSQLLAELDGLDKTGNVFVIGATNRPDLIDPALLRPGRFDKLLFVGIGEDWTSKLKVLEALTMKFSLDPELKLAEVAKRCPPNLTGADLYALCTDAMMNTLSRRIENIQKGTGKQEDPVTVTLEDFDQALEVLVPSISLKELQHYQQLKNSLVS